MGPSKKVKQQQLDISGEQLDIARTGAAREEQLFGTTFPGLGIAEKYYQSLASGDPDEIFRAIAPATEQITSASEQAKERIRTTMPRGGESRVAQEYADIGAAGQVGSLATKAYTSAFPALASLATSGIGLSINEMANAIASMSGAAETTGRIGDQQAAGKEALMSSLGGMAGMAGTLGAAGITRGGSSSSGSNN